MINILIKKDKKETDQDLQHKIIFNIAIIRKEIGLGLKREGTERDHSKTILIIHIELERIIIEDKEKILGLDLVHTIEE